MIIAGLSRCALFCATQICFVNADADGALKALEFWSSRSSRSSLKLQMAAPGNQVLDKEEFGTLIKDEQVALQLPWPNLSCETRRVSFAENFWYWDPGRRQDGGFGCNAPAARTWKGWAGGHSGASASFFSLCLAMASHNIRCCSSLLWLPCLSKLLLPMFASWFRNIFNLPQLSRPLRCWTWTRMESCPSTNSRRVCHNCRTETRHAAVEDSPVDTAEVTTGS